METSHSEHVLQEEVVLGAADVGLQLRGQRDQQFVQTSRKEKTSEVQKAQREFPHARWKKAPEMNMLTCQHSAVRLDPTL